MAGVRTLHLRQFAAEGVPRQVVRRAGEVLRELEREGNSLGQRESRAIPEHSFRGMIIVI